MSTWPTQATITLKQKIRKVAINDLSPLQAAKRDAIANLKSCWPSLHRDLISII